MNYLITGASRGIGYEVALSLASSVDHRLFVLSRTREGLEQLIATAKDRYGFHKIEVLVADIATIDPVAVHDWIAPFGKLDGVINNAGLLINKPFLELTVEDWNRSFDINFFSVVRLLQALYPLLAGAHVLNIGSMGGFQGGSKFAGLAAYSASKAALANLTECLSEEWKADGIAVNCLALGAVQTEMLSLAFPGFKAPVSSSEMGAMVAWFLLNGHRFFNGKVLPVSMSTP